MRSATRALTILAEISDRERLADRLIEINADHEGNRWFCVGKLPNTHFTRFVIIDDKCEDGSNLLPAMLAWESNYDGDEDAYLDAAAKLKLANIFDCCAGYPGSSDQKRWRAWMHDHSYRAAAFYSAYPGVPHDEISNDIAVHAKLRDLADDSKVADLQPRQVHRRFRDDLATSGLQTSPIADEKLRWYFDRFLAILAAIVIFPFLLVFILVWWLPTLLKREREDAVGTIDKPVHDNGLAEEEDKIRQNQLTHVVDLKPGVFRSFTVWAVVNVIGVLASVFYVNGHLGGITSIHFARWVIVRDRRKVPRAKRRDRLVFFSNYDGSWESYLGEFIDRASMGLTAIWSNTEGFPRTKLLIFAGATDEERFKQWTRDHQIVTQVWWSGVPLSTVQNVRDDIWLRRRLGTNLDDKGLTAWLRRV
ncbi:MAG: hypothetical protein ABI591_34390 [Kofleriaceae bacterium]